LISKSQVKLLQIQDQTEGDNKFPYDENRLIKFMSTKESVENASRTSSKAGKYN
jgi:hypothetical protein